MHNPAQTLGTLEPARGPLVPPRFGRWYLTVEFGALFVAVPMALYVNRHSFSTRIISTLVLVAVGCVAVLVFDRNFDRRLLWNTAGLRAGVIRTLRRFVPLAAVVTLFVALFNPELLFAFPRDAPVVWAVIMVLYPVLSVYPQELIFRTFLFHRYRALFPPRTLVVVSGVAFGLGHVFFANLVAPIATVLGGLLFASTYARSGSTLQAVIEHGLWGNFVFTVGLGWYFYGGSIS